MATNNGAHPILDMPNEILQEIFIWCSYADQNDEGYSIVSASRAPLALSYVCSTWRQVALHTPELWRRLHLDWTARKRWSPSLLGQLWLSRCNSLPIYISVHENEDGYLGYDNTGVLFVLKYSTQLLSLSISHSQRHITQEGVIELGGLRFPILRHLELKGGWSTIVLAGRVGSWLYPQLSSYRLDQLPSINGLEDSFKWTQTLSGSITHLDIQKVYIREDEFRIVANMFPLLSDLGVTVTFVLELQAQQQQMIVFPNLCRLKLTHADGEGLVDDDGDPVLPSLVFNRLLASNLIALETNYAGEPIDHNQYYVAKAVYEFVQRSECALQELSVFGWEYDDCLNGTRIMELANTIPTLRKLFYDGVLGSYGYCSQALSIHHLHEHSDIHPFIRTKGDKWEFLPLLEELHFHIDGDDSSLMGDSDSKPILPQGLTVVERRMKSSSNRLKRCYATVITRRPSGISKFVSDALVALEELGLSFKIRNLTLNEEEDRRLPQQPPLIQQMPAIHREEWTAYPN